MADDSSTSPAQQHEESSGGEEDELFGQVVSAASRGSSEAATGVFPPGFEVIRPAGSPLEPRDAAEKGAATQEELHPPTSPLAAAEGEKEFKLGGAPRSLSDVPLDDIAQMDQTDQSVRATAATEFHFPTKPTYRGIGPTLVEPNLAGGAGRLGGPPSSLMNPSQQPLVDPPGTGSGATSSSPPPPRPLPNMEGLTVQQLVKYYRLETHTHSKLQLGERTEEDAVGVICGSLTAQSVDWEFKAHKCKWKCCHARDAVCVFFVVRLWKRSGMSEGHVVEFQRRHGDATAFMGFYRTTVQAMQAQGLGVETKATSTTFGRPTLQPAAYASSGLMGLEVPTMQQSVPSEEELEKFVTPLKEMVESKLLDSVLEGTRALAQLSVQADHRMAMHKCGVVEALVGFLSDAANFGLLETAAQIFAVACLANMSEEPIVQSSLFRACPLLLGHIDNGQYSDRAMRREAARTLRNLAQDDEGADAMIKRCGKKKLEEFCMETLPNLDDESMRQDAEIVQRKIQARWTKVA